MLITCPYCRSDARLVPGPVPTAKNALPTYRMECSGCDHVTVRPDNQELLLVALVGNRHGCGEHELTVVGEETHSIRFHTDPTGQRTPVVEHSALLEGITRGAEASKSFSLLLRTEEVGARFHSAEGNIPYHAMRGWIVTNGDFRALSREEIWEVSCRGNDLEIPLDPEAGVHYVDADAIAHPYRWQIDPVR